MRDASDTVETPVTALAKSRLPWRKSVRVRLLSIALLPMLVVMPLFLGLVAANWSSRFDRLLIAKVNGELTIAHQFLSALRELSSERVAALGASAAFAKMQADGDSTQMAAFLETERVRLGFDFLYHVDPNGTVLSAPPDSMPSEHMKWPVVRAAINGQGTTEVDIFQADDLTALSPTLADMARIKLVPTKAALPTTRTFEPRGMVVHTATPVKGGQGVLVAGTLLNRNLKFIDTINDLVYPAASLTEGSRGTATLFLEDVRISTNVRLFENVRALGTRVSVEVRSSVLDQGHVWLDRAFVVNDWYISAYEPIIDSFGARVGMLYVGFLDSPFRAAKARTLWMIAAGFVVLIALSVPIFLRVARGIFHPLEDMVATIGKVEQGDLGARSRSIGNDDEIAQVSGHLDLLLDRVQQRDREQRNWARELNDRVDERTRELREANQRLEATTKQLVVSEKLAAVGEITAGIAHEINNPIAVIQGNLDVIREELGAGADAMKVEFGLIYEQVHLINILVNKLLQFARPEEYAGVIDQHVPNEVVNDCIPLVQHLLNKVQITLELDLRADRLVAMNRTELQQVLINLLVNAIHAMPDGGRLLLRSVNHDHEGVEGVEVEVTDTGSGMTAQVIDNIFDPFFTTKQSEGTGLGLSISQKLVSRSGGHIRVKSKPGSGTSFNIWVPCTE
ncbi:MAG: cache domain-containing protein [Rhodobacteraceae bacterium]|nr:cache domain-containing protein [Paracoccaceae bacterium]